MSQIRIFNYWSEISIFIKSFSLVFFSSILLFNSYTFNFKLSCGYNILLLNVINRKTLRWNMHRFNYFLEFTLQQLTNLWWNFCTVRGEGLSSSYDSCDMKESLRKVDMQCTLVFLSCHSLTYIYFFNICYRIFGRLNWPFYFWTRTD